MEHHASTVDVKASGGDISGYSHITAALTEILNKESSQLLLDIEAFTKRWFDIVQELRSDEASLRHELEARQKQIAAIDAIIHRYACQYLLFSISNELYFH